MRGENQGFAYRDSIGASAVGSTVLEFLAARYRHSTAAEWEQRIRNGEVRLDGACVRPEERLHAGQRLVWQRRQESGRQMAVRTLLGQRLSQSQGGFVGFGLGDDDEDVFPAHGRTQVSGVRCHVSAIRQCVSDCPTGAPYVCLVPDT